MVGFQTDRALRRLADPLAFWRILDSVAHCVANQMCDGLGDRIQDALVEIRLLSADNQFHLLPAVPGHVTDDTRETAEKLFHRHHADLHHRTLKVVEHPRLKSHGIGELTAQWLLGKASGELVHRLLQHGFADDQLADQVQNVIDALRVHAQCVLGTSCDLGLHFLTILLLFWSRKSTCVGVAGCRDRLACDFRL